LNALIKKFEAAPKKENQDIKMRQPVAITLPTANQAPVDLVTMSTPASPNIPHKSFGTSAIPSITITGRLKFKLPESQAPVVKRTDDRPPVVASAGTVGFRVHCG
jgi:hypothetical protein